MTSCIPSIVLVEPEIPPNTGNIIRLAANCGADLHLVHPMGFQLSDKSCRRAGLDYREYAAIKEYPSLEAFLASHPHRRMIACTTKATQAHSALAFHADDMLLMGAETRGLPEALIKSLPASQRIRIPMLPDSRSLNLSNATAIIIYEAWRQLGFQPALAST